MCPNQEISDSSKTKADSQLPITPVKDSYKNTLYFYSIYVGYRDAPFGKAKRSTLYICRDHIATKNH